MAKRKGFTLRKVTLNNKSRKGDYYYIKEKGGKPAYYKVQEGVSIDNYLMAYKGKVKVKRKGVVTYGKESPAQQYLKKVMGTKKIDDLIDKGITETYVPNFKYIGRKGYHNTYKRMLKPLVNDEELLNIIALEENVNKFKHRIELKVRLSSEDGRVEIPLKIFNKNLIDLENDLRFIYRKKKMQEMDLVEFLKRGYKLDGTPKGADLTNYKDKVLIEKLGKVSVSVRFVKGK